MVRTFFQVLQVTFSDNICDAAHDICSSTWFSAPAKIPSNWEINKEPWKTQANLDPDQVRVWLFVMSIDLHESVYA